MPFMIRLILLALLLGGWATAIQAQDKLVPQGREDLTLSFAPIVRQAAPAVVNIYTSKITRRRQYSPFGNDDFFRRFFGGSDSGRNKGRIQNSLGSGVIVSLDGLVVTNHHVIEGADEIKVALADRREFDAEIITQDEQTDLAILKILDNGEFDFLEFADSDLLEVGDLVLAIGNPFGVGQTVTSGIVSALARTRVGISDFGFFIQTDAAINPGNSGGALLDMQGRVVGINTAIFSRSGGSHGIGFAIPSNMVRTVVASAVQGDDDVDRPWFGAKLQPVTAEIAESHGMQRPMGVLVANVLGGSPADDAGIRTGDVITLVDGREISDPTGFRYRFATGGVGGVSVLTVFRSGRTKEVEVDLVAAPEDPPRDIRDLDGPSPFAGARIANLSPAVAEELSLDMDKEGAIVIAVGRRSPARNVGFRPGDIVLAVNGQDIRTTADLESAVRRQRRVWRIEIERDGRVIRSAIGG